MRTRSSSPRAADARWWARARASEAR